MHRKIIARPDIKITELKSSSTKDFKKSLNEHAELYVTDQQEALGIILSLNHYNELMDQMQHLKDLLYNQEIKHRINEKNPKFYSDEEVRGDLSKDESSIDPNDGWE
ncbi:hypothetical protein LASUN_22870 [Lentilactobacillus sunkii]|jgi:hypothetical protein|uniref:Antitoxin n=1 Tax=Lentilactobacillus sunkii TaxID=481719 RepID=A0A1E7X9L2_9LACO|nr:hypothetical protein [Lentilactobacillus sunkii]OFA09805.1 hypothetical protein LASUN_22870 [Lentilactobacillus sunkii]